MSRHPSIRTLCALLVGAFGLLAGAAQAVPYNHINADGTWGVGEWDIATERRCSNTIAPWGNDGNPQSILVTWDADSLYVGVEVNAWNNAALVYIDSDGITTGATNSDFYQGFTMPGWDPDFVFGAYNMQWGSVLGGNPRLRRITPAGTTSSYAGGRFGVKDKNTDGGHGTGLVEIAIPWTDLSAHSNGHVRVAAGTGWALVKVPQVDPAGGLGGESGDELCGTDQVGGTDGVSSTLDTPTDIAYDLDGNGIPDNSVDTVPPTVLWSNSPAVAPSYTGSHTEATVQFSEVVDLATAQAASNYLLDGATVPVAAVRGTPDSTQVVLTFASPLTLGATHTVLVTGVKDRAGNLIVNNGTTNVGCFCIRRLVFTVNMSLHLRTDGTNPDSLTIIGSMSPLQWDPVCRLHMHDDGTHGDAAAGDSVWTTTLDFARTQVCGATPDTTQVDYEFNHRCAEYEGMHHVYRLACGNPIDTLSVWWKDIAPSNFTDKPMDVIFRCDAGTGPLYVNGSQLPLNWNVPSVTPLADDGVSPDSAAADRRWTLTVRFPAGTLKNVGFKYLVDSLGTHFYECGNDRSVFLNDAAYDTVGGTLGPIVITPPGIFGQGCVSVTAVGDGGGRFRLLPNSPNPFSGSTRIRFMASVATDAELGVYDASGRLIRTLFRGRITGGEQSVNWDGRDASGKSVSSGIYFYRFRAGAEVQERRMVVIR
ncbi:MAG: Ig-like domain-containing protein [Candidatus Eisenbacteria bacterium]|nr:Ig-like domain-containing protein [Candidatus Eisenbacteria bacterium]